MDITSLSWSQILVGILLSWTIGLTPPLLIRYAVIRRPLRKGVAILTVTGLWLLEFLFSLGMDIMQSGKTGNHAGLLLLAFLSYYILVRPTKPVPSPQ